MSCNWLCIVSRSEILMCTIKLMLVSPLWQDVDSVTFILGMLKMIPSFAQFVDIWISFLLLEQLGPPPPPSKPLNSYITLTHNRPFFYCLYERSFCFIFEILKFDSILWKALLHMLHTFQTNFFYNVVMFSIMRCFSSCGGQAEGLSVNVKLQSCFIIIVW